MQVKLRQVGNSLGITLPASALKAFDVGVGDIIEIKITKVVSKPRDGWDIQDTWQGAELEQLHLDKTHDVNFDQDEWQW
jgi:antitoxin component of MazEF toxin-antitoxin module